VALKVELTPDLAEVALFQDLLVALVAEAYHLLLDQIVFS
jgi:hypothetical protein